MVEKTQNQTALIPPLLRHARDDAVQKGADMQTAIGFGYQRQPPVLDRGENFTYRSPPMVCFSPSLGCQRAPSAQARSEVELERGRDFHVSFSAYRYLQAHGRIDRVEKEDAAWW